MSNEPRQPGRRIGNYVVDQKVGRGAFAAVWKPRITNGRGGLSP